MPSACDLCSPNHCNICLLVDGQHTGENASKKLRKCSGCQLVLYCGEQHQRLDWPIHKALCKAITAIMTKFGISHPLLINGEPPKEAATMQMAISKLKRLATMVLGRTLDHHENELLSFPRYCPICFHYEKLHVQCLQCEAAAYCSVDHALEDYGKHATLCSKLQLYYTPYKVRVGMSDNTDIKFLQLSTEEDLCRADLASTFETYTGKIVPKQPLASYEDYKLFSAVCDLSYVGSICYALRAVTFKPENCTVLIVGATVEREVWFRDIQVRFFFAQFPQITDLHLYFIGPEIVLQDKTHEEFIFQGKCRKVTLITYQGLLEDFCKLCKVLPSIIVCFNCGFSENIYVAETECTSSSNAKKGKSMPIELATWVPAIIEMVQFPHVPIFFTSYTKSEAELDFAAFNKVVRDYQAEVVTKCLVLAHENPFRDMRPLRNPDVSDSEKIYYRNGFIQGLQASRR